MFVKPKCRFCSASWMPAMGVVATKAFCARCRKERQKIAKRTLGLKRISPADFDGNFLLPRVLRKKKLKSAT